MELVKKANVAVQEQMLVGFSLALSKSLNTILGDCFIIYEYCMNYTSLQLSPQSIKHFTKTNIVD